MFVEVKSGKVNVSLSSYETVECLKYTLNTIEEILCKNREFIKVHRSYILNINFIRKIEKYSEACYYAIGKNFDIPISRNHIKELIALLESEK